MEYINQLTTQWSTGEEPMHTERKVSLMEKTMGEDFKKFFGPVTEGDVW